jgi:hypothetical protein
MNLVLLSYLAGASEFLLPLDEVNKIFKEEGIVPLRDLDYQEQSIGIRSTWDRLYRRALGIEQQAAEKAALSFKWELNDSCAGTTNLYCNRVQTGPIGYIKKDKFGNFEAHSYIYESGKGTASDEQNRSFTHKEETIARNWVTAEGVKLLLKHNLI